MGIQVAPENVLGRDRLIDQIWRKLEKHSIRFTAERRIGKTTVMRKMLAERRSGTELIFIDLEKVDSPHRFTEVVLTEIKPWLSRTQNVAGWFQKFLAEIQGWKLRV
jgi:AAA+ ATPase superfamily predicted ATPase